MKGDRRRLALAAALLGATALCAAPAGPSEAAPRICRQLQAELQGAPRAAAGAGQLRRYDGAIARQRDEIAKARSQSRALGCGFFLFSSDVSQCASLNAALSRMNGNLDSLQRKRDELSGGGKGRSRARLLALLDANDCGVPADRRKPGRDEPVTARADRARLQQFFGETLARAGDPGTIAGRNPLEAMLADEPNLPRGGEYRTMCVRTCDGYFFPMSTAASVSDFERDQKNCESSCPGADMEVFYGQGMDEDAGRMISVATGRPYSALDTAYLYKKPNAEVPQSCGCNVPRSFSIIGGAAGAAPPASQRMQSVSPSVAVVPAARPDPAADPETQANRAGGLDADTIDRLASRTVPPADRKVRVVGPKFLPDPSEAIDLQARDRKPAP